MNKWVERTIFLNVILLIVFLFFDAWLWTLPSYISFSWWQGYPLEPESYIYTQYTPLTRFVRFIGKYTHNGQSGYSGGGASMFNFPLWVFAITIIVNIMLIWKLSKEKVKELPK